MALALILHSGCVLAATAAQHANPQISVKDVPATPAAEIQPTDVRIILTPDPKPTDVRIISTSPDDAARDLVTVTWWLLGANLVLCVITFVMGQRQSRDMRMSIGVFESAASAASRSADAADRAADSARESVEVTKQQARAELERELNRAAHRVMAAATRADQVARRVPISREQLHILTSQGPMPSDAKADYAKTMQERCDRLREMADSAHGIVSAGLEHKSQSELFENLRRLDEHEAQLDAMRDSITEELNRNESESLTIREQKTAMAAASLNARLSTSNK